MDSFFGIGFPELVMILILAGLVLGPQKIRQVARTLGRFVAEMQSISRQFTRQLNAELDAALDAEDVKGAMDDVRALQREVTDLRRQVTSLSDETVAEGRKALEEGEKIFQGREVPPPEAPGNVPRKKEQPRDEESAKTPTAPSAADLPNPIPVPDDPE
ncbi:MAG: twin-arginine translocase TatA/TatE family subunit [Candidatus Promineifilaceae bacterium]|nr:twin-arginine translocase TatA/TatE family subunit [Candidatus Promineifilaceae bacterium]